MLTQARLKEIIFYNPESGDFIWVKNRRKELLGKQAGCQHNRGYIWIRIGSKRYFAHRLAFLYMTGDWPPDQTDHKNMVEFDNCWSNLRLATSTQNQRNRGPRADSTTGLKLIHWYKPSRCYKVATSVDGKLRHFGSYKKLPDAIDAAAQIMLTFHSDFARVA